MDEKIKELIEILKKHGVKRVKVFGSYVRGEAKPDSDLDVIVDFSERKS
ncbi:MAG: nucleotidyltransferase domain-containing protein, partial [Thermoplasmata archaeon]|nr:nucleotidyltransferase domain-containing protein [Thermoplasmata archaeon]